jgi:hypothetical protein
MQAKTLEDLVGTKLTEDDIQKLQQHGVRVKQPGFIYTADFVYGRVNVYLDENKVVTRIGHG